ncbi:MULTISPECIES: DoxX family protein [Actinoplanes]|uniref:DoxX family protein n=1 Tax=Actinoplanes TaxID=1865 RepID=UPI0005F2A32C|nr:MULTISPECIES: DoxX family protein [Actinoplanes]GLY07940.1 membrane protein [Actinoplanes sp. NBRC 101535]
MSIAYTVVAVVYGLANVASATAKIRGVERVAGILSAVGVPTSWFLPLGLLQVAGALGLWGGIAWRPLGIAAATGLVLYFGGAVVAHLRVRDYQGMPMAAVLGALAALTLGLAVASA